MSTTTLGILNGSAAAKSIAVLQTNTDGVLTPLHAPETGLPSYSACVLQLTPVATPTDVVMLTPAGTTYNIRLRKVRFNVTGTAAGIVTATLIRRSTIYTTVGSAVLSSAVTAALHDTTNAAAALTMKTVGTANFTTVGTAVGTIRSEKVFVSDAATIPIQVVTWDFTLEQPIILSGVNDFIYFNMGGSTLPTASKLDFTVEFEQIPA